MTEIHLRSSQAISFSISSEAQADGLKKEAKSDRRKGSKVLKEIHEATANGVFILVGLHVVYLVLMNRHDAIRMIFIADKR
jgi:cytochrome b